MGYIVTNLNFSDIILYWMIFVIIIIGALALWFKCAKRNLSSSNNKEVVE